MSAAATRRGEHGVMLLEVLIGILIFSIGILAMLGMQATGMRATIDAKYRSEAAFLANEIVGIMWGDAGNLGNYATANCPSTPSCDAWRSKVLALLPQDDANPASTAPDIAVGSASGREVTVTVRWKRPADQAASQHQVVAEIFRATD